MTQLPHMALQGTSASYLFTFSCELFGTCCHRDLLAQLLSIQRPAAYTQQPRGTALVAARHSEDPLDVPVLELPEVRDLLVPGARRRRLGPAQARPGEPLQGPS